MDEKCKGQRIELKIKSMIRLSSQPIVMNLWLEKPKRALVRNLQVKVNNEAAGPDVPSYYYVNMGFTNRFIWKKTVCFLVNDFDTKMVHGDGEYFVDVIFSSLFLKRWMRSYFHRKFGGRKLSSRSSNNQRLFQVVDEVVKRFFFLKNIDVELTCQFLKNFPVFRSKSSYYKFREKVANLLRHPS